MTVLNRIASSLGRRDEAPSQELARDLAAQKDKAGIREIAENLWNRDKNIRSKNNRLVWGGMTALAEVTKVDPAAVFKRFDEIKKAKETGSGLSRIKKVIKQAATL